jgi:aminopeptidase N
MNEKQVIHLKDYTEVDYKCEVVNLVIDILDDHAIVTNKSHYKKNPNTNSKQLILNGIDLELSSLKINAEIVPSEKYRVNSESLELSELPDEFELESVCKIKPFSNFSGEGLYKSGNILCTQCEAEGFRKITYHQDRPDVMSSYTTKILADKKTYPKLLSNGNLIDSGDLEQGRHFAVWEDPFKKPSYLFATVAGDLALVKDTFTTKDNREIKLEIFVDHGNEDKCAHAMESLKNSMKWDEQTYGLIYDLDIYMIVAVDSFNMGAMENKGLNIFNSHYVLANNKSATDSDFQGIEAVIGHEYFHNWTGNRVTCRDWFQLTLKEGLTVYRDQEFSSDMGSRAVKRIEDIKILKGSQYNEDAGPLSHPIQPKSYIEINNFYTATIYDKGAEIIRMYHTIVGDLNFKKGLDLYFERHDGSAVTCQDFLKAMSDASGVNLDHFSVWYDQNGTPEVDISTNYIAEKNEFVINLKQNVKTNNSNYNSLYIPFHFELLEENGTNIDIGSLAKSLLDSKEKSLVITNIKSKPIPVFNTNFSAPINIIYDYSMSELLTILESARDEYSKYNSAFKIFEIIINDLVELCQNGKEMVLEQSCLEAFGSILNHDNLDESFKSYLLEPPTLNYFLNKSKNFDFDSFSNALNYLKYEMAKKFENDFFQILSKFDTNKAYKLNTDSIAQRSLVNTSMWYLGHLENTVYDEKIYEVFRNANNMTMELGALKALMVKNSSYAQRACKEFYLKWKDDTLVIQKWFRLNATADFIDIKYIKNLETLEEYDAKIPNLVRSLIGAFSTNLMLVNKEDGSGYKFLCDKILEIDEFNPQIAARLAKSFSYIKKIDSKRQSILSSHLKELLNTSKISSDTTEIINTNLS